MTQSLSARRTPPVIAIVGRPNVGKSTLFNRLIGRRKAVVSSLPGTTRDRIEGTLEWRGMPLTVVDTGGFQLTAQGDLEIAVQRHLRVALREAQGVLFLCDALQGLLPADQLILDSLRRMGKPVVIAVNKTEHSRLVPPEFFALGAATIFPVSALHGLGIGELLDHLAALVAPAGAPRSNGSAHARAASDEGCLSVAIIGRQNVGKSSLFNAFLREERVIVSEIPGTTRDAVDTVLSLGETPLRLIDTAGLRHRRKVKSPVDLFAMARTAEAITRAHVALVVLDATQGVTTDDRRIVTQVCEAGCGLVLVVNKWDLVKGVSERTLAASMKRAAPFAAFAPVVAVSATTGFQVAEALAIAQRVFARIRRGVSEEACRSVLVRAWNAHLPPRIRGRAIRLRNARWIHGRPCRIELATAPVGRLPVPYQHYLLKQLHAHPGFRGVPIKLVVTAAAPSPPGPPLVTAGAGKPRTPTQH